MQRRELPLHFVDEAEIQGRRFVRFAMAQHGSGFARIVIAVVTEEDNLPAKLLLEPSRRPDFGHEKPLRKKSARLLAEAYDGCAHVADALVCFGRPNPACKTRLRNTQAVQPMSGYQR